MSNEPTEQEEAAYEYSSLLNSAARVIENPGDLEDEVKVDVACAMISFQNSHLVASKLVELDPKIADALCSELLSALQ